MVAIRLSIIRPTHLKTTNSGRRTPLMQEPKSFAEVERERLDGAIDLLRNEAEIFAYDADARELANMGLLFSGAPGEEEQSAPRQRGERIRELADHISELVGGVVESGGQESQAEESDDVRGRLFAAAFALQEIDAIQVETEEELRLAQRNLDRPGTPLSEEIPEKVNRLQNFITRRLRPAIEAVSRHLWQIIVNLITPTSWGLQGGVGMPGLMNAQVSITFGR
jgi:hypothetical protein